MADMINDNSNNQSYGQETRGSETPQQSPTAQAINSADGAESEQGANNVQSLNTTQGTDSPLRPDITQILDTTQWPDTMQGQNSVHVIPNTIYQSNIAQGASTSHGGDTSANKQTGTQTINEHPSGHENMIHNNAVTAESSDDNLRQNPDYLPESTLRCRNQSRISAVHQTTNPVLENIVLALNDFIIRRGSMNIDTPPSSSFDYGSLARISNHQAQPSLVSSSNDIVPGSLDRRMVQQALLQILNHMQQERTSIESSNTAPTTQTVQGNHQQVTERETVARTQLRPTMQEPAFTMQPQEIAEPELTTHVQETAVEPVQQQVTTEEHVTSIHPQTSGEEFAIDLHPHGNPDNLPVPVNHAMVTDMNNSVSNEQTEEHHSLATLTEESSYKKTTDAFQRKLIRASRSVSPGGSHFRTARASDGLSIRGQKTLIIKQQTYPCGNNRYGENPFDHKQNEDGIIDMATAYNSMCKRMIEKFISQPVMQISEFIESEETYRGTESFRQTIASFMLKYFKAHNVPMKDGIFVVNGKYIALQLFAFAVADEGDSMLVLSPYHGAIKHALELIYEVEIATIQMKTDQLGQFILCVDDLEKLYKEQKSQGKNIKGLILTNPHDIAGAVFDKESLLNCLNFCANIKLHVCIDESFGLSVYDRASTFTSVLQLDMLPDPKRTHWVWCFSQDLSLAGYTTAIFYTTNEVMKTIIKSQCRFHSITTIVQKQLEQVLNNTTWFNKWRSIHITKLMTYKTILYKTLQSLNIKVIQGSAGTFLWADLSAFLPEKTFHAELQLYTFLLNHCLYVLPGQAFHYHEPGWFRIVFALSEEEFIMAQKILVRTLSILKKNPQKLKKIKIAKELNKTKIYGF